MRISEFGEIMKEKGKNIGDRAQSALAEVGRRLFGSKQSYIEGSKFSTLWGEEWRRYVKGRWGERPLPYNFDASSVLEPTTKLNLVGISLSGGGIRSATFNLGILQALGRLKVLKYCDYLSTVSGGGYIGSCLTSHLHHQAGSELEGEKFPFGFPRPGKEKTGEERPEIRHLRNHSNYLVPRHGLFSLDTWRLVGTYLSGLVVLIPVPLAAFVLAAFALDRLSASLTWLPVPWPSGGPFWSAAPLWKSWRCPTTNAEPTWVCLVSVAWAPPGLVRLSFGFALLSFGCFLLSVILFLLLMLGPSRPEGRNLLARLQSWSLRLMVIILLFAIAPSMVAGWSEIREWAILRWGAGNVNLGKWLFSLFSLLVTIGANREWQKKWLKLVKMPLITVGAVVFLVTIGLNLLDLYRRSPVLAAEVSVFAFVLGWIFLDPDRASLHFLYRDRLTEAYVVKSSGTGPDRFVPDHDLRLSSLCSEKAQLGAFVPPYPLINAAINLAGDLDPDLRWRKAHLFLFSPLFCGSEKTGWRATEVYESGGVDLATAMAISGAAISSQMGMYTSRPLAMLMTLLNARLGSWKQNPRFFRAALRAGMLYTLFRELFSRTSQSAPYVNLSDGGHFENLGLYGLIQRRCRYIIVSDASADASFGLADLANALRKIRIDLGVQVEDLGLSLLKPDPRSGLSARHCAVGNILYPGNEEGVLVYLKPTLSGNEPADLLHYQGRHQTFPHETTMDQFFDEAQFESYRALGYQICKEVFAPARDALEQPGPDVVERIFDSLCRRWQGPERNPEGSACEIRDVAK